MIWCLSKQTWYMNVYGYETLLFIGTICTACYDWVTILLHMYMHGRALSVIIFQP